MVKYYNYKYQRMIPTLPDFNNVNIMQIFWKGLIRLIFTDRVHNYFLIWNQKLTGELKNTVLQCVFSKYYSYKDSLKKKINVYKSYLFLLQNIKLSSNLITFLGRKLSFNWNPTSRTNSQPWSKWREKGDDGTIITTGAVLGLPSLSLEVTQQDRVVYTTKMHTHMG